MDNCILSKTSFHEHILMLRLGTNVDKKIFKDTLKAQSAINLYDIDCYLSDKIAVSIFLEEKIIGYIFLYKPLYYGLALREGDYLIDYILSPKYRNRGIGTKSLELLLNSNISNMINVKRFVAAISDKNTASIKCAMNNGMSKFRIYYIKEV